MSIPLIRINAAPAEELVALYGVGPQLARKIVEYRELHGPFRGPEHLAQVSGLSDDLALTLAPHIDWTSTPIQEVDGVEVTWVDWVRTLFGVTLVGSVMIWGLPRTLGSPAKALREFPPNNWSLAISALSIFVAYGLFASGVLAWVAEEVSASRRTRRRLAKAALRLMSVATLALVYAIISWSVLTNTWQGNILDIASRTMGLLTLTPFWIVGWRPGLAQSKRLHVVFDVMWLLVVPPYAWILWTMRSEAPLWVLLIGGSVGAGAVWVGVQSLRGKLGSERLFASLLYREPATSSSGWMTWLNTRVPRQADQRALQQALNQTYRPSRLRTAAATIVIGAGGWMVVTALGAVVEWFVQRWLDQIP